MEWRTPERYGQGPRNFQKRPIVARKLARSALLAPQRPLNKTPDWEPPTKVVCVVNL
jgi:hypothetical protein